MCLLLDSFFFSFSHCSLSFSHLSIFWYLTVLSLLLHTAIAIAIAIELLRLFVLVAASMSCFVAFAYLSEERRVISKNADDISCRLLLLCHWLQQVAVAIALRSEIERFAARLEN